MKYYNNFKELSAIHIDRHFDISQLLFQDEKDRQISTNITILSDCNENSILYNQCKINNISLIKLDYQNILKQLDNIKTDNVLIVRGDAILLNDFSNIKEDLIICGSNIPLSKMFPINNHNELLKVGENKYINPFMIYGKTDSVNMMFMKYENYCLRNLKMDPFSIKESSEVEIFNLWYSTVHNRYKVDSEGNYFASINRDNYGLIEIPYNDEMSRHLKLINYNERKYRLF